MRRGLVVARERPLRFAAKALAVARPLNAVVLARHAKSLADREPWGGYVHAQGGQPALARLADETLAWIGRAQDRSGDGGVASFEFYAWSSGYPEVTGYTIPTLWDYHHRLGRADLAARAIRMADWELAIQRPEGGWQSGYVHQDRPPVVFNTGQVLRGLVRAHAETEDERYLAAAIRGADWIVANQEADGSWGRANYRGLKRVYDSYVAAPLARLAVIADDDSYAESAARCCEFVLRHQSASGWFALCDNSEHFNDMPSTHTLCYTIDGLLEAGKLLGEPRFEEAGRRAADALATRVDRSGRLAGRFDERWAPRVRWVCVPGSAQLGAALMTLHRRTGEARYRETAERLLDFLVWVQRLSSVGRERSGGLPGSYPIWGLYSPLTYPCWAAKYFLDLAYSFLAPGRTAAPADARVGGRA